MKLGSFDAAPFREAAQQMRMLEADWKAFLERFVHQLGQVALGKFKKHTPSNSGGLREAWEVHDVRLTAGGAEVVIVNPLEYASYVNDGFKAHFVPGHWEGNELVYQPGDPEGGMFVGENKGDFIPGRHMVELTEKDIERMLPAAMKSEFAKWAKQLGFEVSG